MPAERYFHPKEFIEGANLLLENQEFHHLAHVMRSKANDEVELVNGRGQLAMAHITAITKKHATLTVGEVATESPSSKQLILAQAIPRMNRLEFILEKSTELGATEIWLFPASLSERKGSTEHQQERWNNILISAMKQCGRLFLPKLLLQPPIKEWKTLPSSSFFGDIAPLAPPFAEIWPKHQNSNKTLFCVGPESGFTDEETSLLKGYGAHGVKLHPNILRTDTAALMALSLISHWQMY